MIKQDRLRIVPPVVLTASALLGAVGCGLVPSDPAESVTFGARVEGDAIIVKIPLCSTDTLRRVEVIDFDDAERATPPVLWWASNPTASSAKEGVVKLWSGEGFDHYAVKPSTIPRNIEVDYFDRTDRAGGDVFDLHTISTAKLKAGKYWTHNGPRTAAEINAQLGCTSQ